MLSYFYQFKTVNNNNMLYKLSQKIEILKDINAIIKNTISFKP